MSLSLKFDPKTIEHLGVKMYSTLPPALAELISNAYDADADEVIVEFIEQNGSPVSINIEDNGCGMSLNDIQEKFLVIGRNRRKTEGDIPSKKYKRLPTGKKGLGKLSLFGIAHEVTIETIKNGLRNRFGLNWDDLLKSDNTYNPKIFYTNNKVDLESKTIIQLSALKRKSPFDIESIADSLSRLFIVDTSFKIILKSNKKKIIISNDRRYSNIEKQFEWGDVDLISNECEYFGKVQLFFITGKTPIPASSGLRGIALFSRGKLVSTPEYFSESTSSHFYQYITGWIKADFIDLLDEDVISTNRQALVWDNPDMLKFRKFLSDTISKVGREWRKLREEKKEGDINKIIGINKKNWIETLPDDVKKSVNNIIKNMGENEEVSETFAPVIKALYDIVPEYPLLHWRHLHPSIKEDIFNYYKNQQYGHAADQGAKIYASQIRELTQKDIDGTELANSFNYDFDSKNKIFTREPDIKINELNTESLRNIQNGQGHLTRGLMQGFRNPINHAPMSKIVPEMISELDCLNILSLISYLAKRLEYAKEIKNVKNKIDSEDKK